MSVGRCSNRQGLLAGESLTTPPPPPKPLLSVPCGRCGFFPMTSCGYFRSDEMEATMQDYHQQMLDCTSRIHTTDIQSVRRLKAQRFLFVRGVVLHEHEALEVTYDVIAVRDALDVQFVMHSHGPAP